MIRIGDVYSWVKIDFNLEQIAKDAGRRVTEIWADDDGRPERHTYVVLPLPQARKIINAILEYGEDADIEQAEEVFRSNQKLYRIWKEKRDGKEW